MTERERFNRIQQKYPHPHIGFQGRPHASRRQFFQLLGAGVSGYFLKGPWGPEPLQAQANVEPRNTAKQVIFLFLSGAPSHIDMFDFKNVPGVTPADFNPVQFGDVTIPTGLLGNTAQVLDKLAIIRSGLSWALAHNLAQTWFQIGRNPTSALGKIAPHMGSVVAIEKEPERRPDQIFPAFMALNDRNSPGSGFLPSEFGPFKTIPTDEGLAGTTHPDGQVRFEARWNALQLLDAPLRSDEAPLGDAASGMNRFYESARQMMFNPVVEDTFSFTPEEAERYGNSGFGNACLLAKKIVEADQGTRFIQVTHNSWDHHQNIYNPAAGQSLYAQCGEFDPAFAALLNDLEAAGQLDETLVVAAGEFGRTVGPLTAGREGRDHYLQMFYVLAGGGVKGGTVIGETDPTGAFTVEPGWSRFRDVRPEDIEATIYSALGINWATVRDDDPLGRGFEYVPMASEDVYGPVDEVFA